MNAQEYVRLQEFISTGCVQQRILPNLTGLSHILPGKDISVFY